MTLYTCEYYLHSYSYSKSVYSQCTVWSRLWNQIPDSFRHPCQPCLDSTPRSLVSSSLSSSPHHTTGGENPDAQDALWQHISNRNTSSQPFMTPCTRQVMNRIPGNVTPPCMYIHALLRVDRKPGRRQFSADELTSSARYVGHRPTWIWCISRHSLNLMLNCTGNQCNCASSGVMSLQVCARCNGSMVDCGSTDLERKGLYDTIWYCVINVQ